MLVTGEDSARGLLFDDRDPVFLVQNAQEPRRVYPPRRADEAAQKGGNRRFFGGVGRVSEAAGVVQHTLRVNFEPLDTLNVVNRRIDRQSARTTDRCWVLIVVATQDSSGREVMVAGGD